MVFRTAYCGCLIPRYHHGVKQAWFRPWFGFALRPIALKGWLLVAATLMVEALIGWASFEAEDGSAWWLFAGLFALIYAAFYVAARSKTIGMADNR